MTPGTIKKPEFRRKPEDSYPWAAAVAAVIAATATAEAVAVAVGGGGVVRGTVARLTDIGYKACAISHFVWLLCDGFLLVGVMFVSSSPCPFCHHFPVGVFTCAEH